MIWASILQMRVKAATKTCDVTSIGSQSRADDLAAARAADTESSADRAAREAMVRRLDNERQYLKSQLQSEITCKDELREALAKATRQLGDIKVRSDSQPRVRGATTCDILSKNLPHSIVEDERR